MILFFHPKSIQSGQSTFQSRCQIKSEFCFFFSRKKNNLFTTWTKEMLKNVKRKQISNTKYRMMGNKQHKPKKQKNWTKKKRTWDPIEIFIWVDNDDGLIILVFVILFSFFFFIKYLSHRHSFLFEELSHSKLFFIFSNVPYRSTDLLQIVNIGFFFLIYFCLWK